MKIWFHIYIFIIYNVYTCIEALKTTNELIIITSFRLFLSPMLVISKSFYDIFEPWAIFVMFRSPKIKVIRMMECIRKCLEKMIEFEDDDGENKKIVTGDEALPKTLWRIISSNASLIFSFIVSHSAEDVCFVPWKTSMFLALCSCVWALPTDDYDSYQSTTEKKRTFVLPAQIFFAFSSFPFSISLQHA